MSSCVSSSLIYTCQGIARSKAASFKVLLNWFGTAPIHSASAMEKQSLIDITKYLWAESSYEDRLGFIYQSDYVESHR